MYGAVNLWARLVSLCFIHPALFFLIKIKSLQFIYFFNVGLKIDLGAAVDGWSCLLVDRPQASLCEREFLLQHRITLKQK